MRKKSLPIILGAVSTTIFLLFIRGVICAQQAAYLEEAKNRGVQAFLDGRTDTLDDCGGFDSEN